MACSTVAKLVRLMLICMVMASPMAEAAMTCGLVVRSLTPCVNYVENGGAVSGECCNGIKTLYSSAKTTPDRQAVCKCIKSAIDGISYTGNNVANAAALPGKCGLNIPYKLDPKTDCDKVN